VPHWPASSHGDGHDGIQHRRRGLLAGAAVMLFVAMGCGGTKGPTTPSNPGTPSAGPTVYTITDTATSGQRSHSTILTLTVQ
jgi:hypothetical protein